MNARQRRVSRRASERRLYRFLSHNPGLVNTLRQYYEMWPAIKDYTMAVARSLWAEP